MGRPSAGGTWGFGGRRRGSTALSEAARAEGAHVGRRRQPGAAQPPGPRPTPSPRRDDPDADDGEVSHQDPLARELGARRSSASTTNS